MRGARARPSDVIETHESSLLRAGRPEAAFAALGLCLEGLHLFQLDLNELLEHQLRQASNGDMIAMQPDQLANLVDKFKSAWELASMQNGSTAILVDSSLRLPLRQTVHRSLPQVSIISYSEIPHDLLIEPVTVIRHDDVFKVEPQLDSESQQAQYATEEQSV